MLQNDELMFLIDNFEDIAIRPERYGYPETVEMIGLQISHIILNILHTDWNKEQTQNLWLDVLGRNSVVKKRYETNLSRQRKWGSLESKAQQKVLQAYQDIWNDLHKELDVTQFYPATSHWVKNNLNNAFGSPDMIATVFRVIMSLAIDDEGYKKFLVFFEEKCKRLKNRETSRGLLDVDVLPTWKPELIPNNIVRDEFAQIQIAFQKIHQYLASHSTN